MNTSDRQAQAATKRNADSSEYTSPVREVVNSALSLAAVVGLSLLGSLVLHQIAGRIERNR